MATILINTILAWLIAIVLSSITAMCQLSFGAALNAAPLCVGALAFVVALWFLFADYHSDKRLRSRACGMLVFINALCVAPMLAFASMVWGLGWDGQGIHQSVVRYLDEGLLPGSKPSMNAFFGDKGYHEIYDKTFPERFNTFRFGFRDPEDLRTYYITHGSIEQLNVYIESGEIREHFFKNKGKQAHAMAHFRGLGLLPEFSIPGIGHVLYAAIVKGFNNMESAKAYNLLLGVMAGLLMALAVRGLGVRKHFSVFIGALLVLHPVSIVQYFTFSVDTQVASLSAMLIAWSLLVYRRQDKRCIIGYCLCALLLAATKMNGTAYALIITSAVLLFYGISQKKQLLSYGPRAIYLSIAIILLFAMAAAVTVLPRVLKQDAEGNTDWSFLKQQVVHYMNYDAVGLPDLKNMSAPERTWHSILNQTAHGSILQPKVPYETHLREIKMYTKLYEGPELGGYGPYFSASLLWAFALVLWITMRSSNPHKRFVLYLVLVVVAATLLMPSAYLARLNPLLWLLPILILGLSLCTRGSRSMRWIRLVLAVTLAMNAAHAAAWYAWGQLNVQAAYREQFSEIKRLKQPVEVAFRHQHPVERRFIEQGIRYQPVSEIGDDHCIIQLLRTPLQSGIHIGLDPEDPNAISVYKNLKMIEKSLRDKQIPLPMVHDCKLFSEEHIEK